MRSSSETSRPRWRHRTALSDFDSPAFLGPGTWTCLGPASITKMEMPPQGRCQHKTERSQGCSVTEQCSPPTCGNLGGKPGLFQPPRPFCVGPALLLLAPTPACPFLALWASQEHGPVLTFPSFTPLSSTGRYLKPWCHPPPHESRGRLTVTAQSPALFVFKKDSREDYLGDRTRQAQAGGAH